MVRRLNHRGWIVLESITSGDGMLCVDFFEDPDGGYGFEHMRADPEDRGRWTAVGGFGAGRFTTPLEAAEAAADSVAWLVGERSAGQAWEDWTTHLRVS